MIKKSKLIVDVNEAFGAPLIYLYILISMDWFLYDNGLRHKSVNK